MHKQLWIGLALLSLVLLQPARSEAAESAGECRVMLLLSVIDGDTVRGYIDTSDPEVAVHASLRLLGIDTPEIGGHARCDEEKLKGTQAREFLKSVLEPALAKPTRKLVRACNVDSDKYAKRRLGRLEVKLGGRWTDISDLMLEKGLAFPYKGGRRGTAWCGCLQSGQCPAGYQG
jgi:endonuclease YncB( thermonuclease family)